jgi:SAM-dependent methyltransferase
MMVRASDALWKEGGGYYSETEDQLRASPILPNSKRLCDQRIMRLFDTYVNWAERPTILEIGCGRSPWLAYLARRQNCTVIGIDVEPFAARLAQANLTGAGANGEVLCRDAFDLQENQDLFRRFDFIYSWGVMEHFDDAERRAAILANYLRPGGRILTLVPNLQGLNSLMQRFADRERYDMHVIYNTDKLRHIHEIAGFKTIASGYVGFCDGYLSASQPHTPPLRRRIHDRLCWILGMSSEAWNRTLGKAFAPEMRWLAPHVFYIGERLQPANSAK